MVISSDFIGKIFGKLTVVNRLPNTTKEPTWLCVCECGFKVEVRSSKLKRGQDRCKKCSAKKREKHGKCGTKEYKAWNNMIQRCTNPKTINYPYYGGEGILVCERWLNSFELFYEDMGDAPSPKHSLDRYPNQKGNYEPLNCRWGTDEQQSRNKRNNKIIEFNGVRKCLVEWCEEYGLEKRTLCGRLLKGWSVEKAITTPVKKSRKGELYKK